MTTVCDESTTQLGPVIAEGSAIYVTSPSESEAPDEATEQSSLPASETTTKEKKRRITGSTFIPDCNKRARRNSSELFASSHVSDKMHNQLCMQLHGSGRRIVDTGDSDIFRTCPLITVKGKLSLEEMAVFNKISHSVITIPGLLICDNKLYLTKLMAEGAYLKNHIQISDEWKGMANFRDLTTPLDITKKHHFDAFLMLLEFVQQFFPLHMKLEMELSD